MARDSKFRYVRQRGPNAWQIQMPNGKVDANGNRGWLRETVHGTADEAIRRRDEIEVDLRRGHIATTRETVRWLVTAWLESKQYIRLRTRERYELVIQRHIIPHFGERRLAELKPFDFRELYANLRNRGVGAETIRLAHIILRQATNQAVDDDVLPKSPIGKATPERHKPEEVKPPPPDKVREMLDLMKEERPGVYPLVCLAAATGMRRGEVAALRWENINLADGEIRIMQSRVVSRSKGAILQDPKTKSGMRTVFIDQATIAVLRAHRDRQDAHIKAMDGAYEDKGWVMANVFGDLHHPNILSDAVVKLSRRVNQPMHFHLLRHHHASLLLHLGISDISVSKRLGHSSPTVTRNIYAHNRPEWDKVAAERYAEAMEMLSNSCQDASAPNSASSPVSVARLANVPATTPAVTNCGFARNCVATIVVKIAVGIAAMTMTTRCSTPSRPKASVIAYARPAAPISRTTTATTSDGSSVTTSPLPIWNPNTRSIIGRAASASRPIGASTAAGRSKPMAFTLKAAAAA